MTAVPTFRYLQLENGWPSFVLSGLSVGADGAMTLAPVPTVTTPVTAPLPPVPGLSGPAGIGVDCDGTLYIADPAHHQILRVDPCDGAVCPVPCLRLDTPRGVHVGPRCALYIADSGSSRIVVVDLITTQVLTTWGGFQQPWDVTSDRAGKIYVADPGAQNAAGTWSGGRVRKFDPGGRELTNFSTTIAEQPIVPGAPSSIAIGVMSGTERLLVLDQQPARLLAYQLDGTYDAVATAQWDAVAGMVSTPVSLAVGTNQLYIADAGTGLVLVFGTDGTFLGIVRRADAPVAGLGLNCHGQLVVHPGSGGSVLTTGAGLAYATCGTFLAGPFVGDAMSAQWQRVRVALDALPVGAHIQLFCWASDTMDGSTPALTPPSPAPCGSPPSPSIVTPTTVDAAPLDAWRAAPRDAGDILALTVPSRYLWLAGVLQGDSTVTPTIRQIRLEYDRPGWIQYLPAIYRNNPVAQVFLDRALAMFRSFLDDEYGLIYDLPRLFDAGAAPDGPPGPAWLDWLATWFATDLDARWSESTRRQTVASAFQRDAWRGTRASLRDLVTLYAGVTPWIEELGIGAAAWSLGNVSSLGFDTILTAESPDGAVLGATAVVDRSALIDAASYGAPVFADVANRFTVQVYAAQLPADGGEAAALDSIRSVLDREKPAHTTYELCVIDARMRVGAQARLGIDTIVGGPPRPAPMDGTLELGADTVLADESARRRRMSVMGEDARVGVRSTLV